MSEFGFMGLVDVRIILGEILAFTNLTNLNSDILGLQ
jgi:hypothetical protein